MAGFDSPELLNSDFDWGSDDDPPRDVTSEPEAGSNKRKSGRRSSIADSGMGMSAQTFFSKKRPGSSVPDKQPKKQRNQYSCTQSNSPDTPHFLSRHGLSANKSHSSGHVKHVGKQSAVTTPRSHKRVDTDSCRRQLRSPPQLGDSSQHGQCSPPHSQAIYTASSHTEYTGTPCHSDDENLSALSTQQSTTDHTNSDPTVKSALKEITCLLNTVVKRVERVENELKKQSSVSSSSESTPSRSKVHVPLVVRVSIWHDLNPRNSGFIECNLFIP